MLSCGCDTRTSSLLGVAVARSSAELWLLSCAVSLLGVAVEACHHSSRGVHRLTCNGILYYTWRQPRLAARCWPTMASLIYPSN